MKYLYPIIVLAFAIYLIHTLASGFSILVGTPSDNEIAYLTQDLSTRLESGQDILPLTMDDILHNLKARHPEAGPFIRNLADHFTLPGAQSPALIDPATGSRLIAYSTYRISYGLFQPPIRLTLWLAKSGALHRESTPESRLQDLVTATHVPLIEKGLWKQYHDDPWGRIIGTSAIILPIAFLLIYLDHRKRSRAVLTF